MVIELIALAADAAVMGLRLISALSGAKHLLVPVDKKILQTLGNLAFLLYQYKTIGRKFLEKFRIASFGHSPLCLVPEATRLIMVDDGGMRSHDVSSKSRPSSSAAVCGEIVLF